MRGAGYRIDGDGASGAALALHAAAAGAAAGDCFSRPSACLSLAASYAVTQRSFEQAIRADLAQDIAGFRAAPNARAVALLVDAESRETDPNRLCSAISPRRAASMATGPSPGTTRAITSCLWPARAEYDGVYLSLTDAAVWRAVDRRAQPGTRSNGLRTVFLNILLISLLPTVLVALSGGLYLARRSKRHVEVIGRTLDRT